nr:hypothetical protein [Rickettsia canadensis]
MGVPKEELQPISVYFVVSSKTRTHNGRRQRWVGLALYKKIIIELYAGKIWAENDKQEQ